MRKIDIKEWMKLEDGIDKNLMVLDEVSHIELR
jgi:hypothetical protein